MYIQKMPAVYSLGNMRLKGFVDVLDDVGYEDQLFEFNTPERIKEGKRSLLVSSKDIKIVVKWVTDWNLEEE